MSNLRTFSRPDKLAFTPDERAQQLIAQSSIAFVIGFVLDQRVRIQLAFAAPYELQTRLGHLDPARIAAMSPAEIEAVFVQAPPLHRYPNSMAQRVRACMEWIVEHHDGDVDQVWLQAKDLSDLKRRITSMPGFGPLKAIAVSAVLARHFEVDVDGWDRELPPYGSLAYVDSIDDLLSYQDRKARYKKAIRSGATPEQALDAISAGSTE